MNRLVAWLSPASAPRPSTEVAEGSLPIPMPLTFSAKKVPTLVSEAHSVDELNDLLAGSLSVLARMVTFVLSQLSRSSSVGGFKGFKGIALLRSTVSRCIRGGTSDPFFNFFDPVAIFPQFIVLVSSDPLASAGSLSSKDLFEACCNFFMSSSSTCCSSLPASSTAGLREYAIYSISRSDGLFIAQLVLSTSSVSSSAVEGDPNWPRRFRLLDDQFSHLSVLSKAGFSFLGINIPVQSFSEGCRSFPSDTDALSGASDQAVAGGVPPTSDAMFHLASLAQQRSQLAAEMAAIRLRYDLPVETPKGESSLPHDKLLSTLPDRSALLSFARLSEHNLASHDSSAENVSLASSSDVHSLVLDSFGGHHRSSSPSLSSVSLASSVRAPSALSSFQLTSLSSPLLCSLHSELRSHKRVSSVFKALRRVEQLCPSGEPTVAQFAQNVTSFLCADSDPGIAIPCLSGAISSLCYPQLSKKSAAHPARRLNILLGPLSSRDAIGHVQIKRSPVVSSLEEFNSFIQEQLLLATTEVAALGQLASNLADSDDSTVPACFQSSVWLSAAASIAASIEVLIKFGKMVVSQYAVLLSSPQLHLTVDSKSGLPHFHVSIMAALSRFLLDRWLRAALIQDWQYLLKDFSSSFAESMAFALQADSCSGGVRFSLQQALGFLGFVCNSNECLQRGVIPSCCWFCSAGRKTAKLLLCGVSSDSSGEKKSSQPLRTKWLADRKAAKTAWLLTPAAALLPPHSSEVQIWSAFETALPQWAKDKQPSTGVSSSTVTPALSEASFLLDCKAHILAYFCNRQHLLLPSSKSSDASVLTSATAFDSLAFL